MGTAPGGWDKKPLEVVGVGQAGSRVSFMVCERRGWHHRTAGEQLCASVEHRV